MGCRCWGDLCRRSWEMQKLCMDAQNRSASFDDVQVNFCLNYGGRDEIVRAARDLATRAKAGTLDPDEITEDLFAQSLYSAGVPDPELVIRPSGEKRLSNFLPGPTGESEVVYRNVLWPGVTPTELAKAIAEYHRRSRRFGGV